MYKHCLLLRRSIGLGAVTLLGMVFPFGLMVDKSAYAETRGFGVTWESFAAGTKIVAVDTANKSIKVTQPDAPIKINPLTRIRKCETNLLVNDLRVGDIVTIGPISNIEGLRVSEISKTHDLRLMSGHKPVKEIGRLVLRTPFLAPTREQSIGAVGTLSVYELTNGTSYVDININAADAERVSFTRYTPLKFSDLAPGQVIAGEFYRSNAAWQENEMGTEHFEVVVEKTKGFNGRFRGRLPEGRSRAGNE